MSSPEAPNKNLRLTTMQSANDSAREATELLTRWLQTRPETLGVVNVEGDARYQKADVDLLWSTEKRQKENPYKVEIKVDQRAHDTGNFFFETWSNFERQTPGCFLYTEADLLFYYLDVPKHLYILPMPDTRDWFLANPNVGRERSTQTPVRGGKAAYTTKGRIIPIATVLRGVTDVITRKVRDPLTRMPIAEKEVAATPQRSRRR